MRKSLAVYVAAVLLLIGPAPTPRNALARDTAVVAALGAKVMALPAAGETRALLVLQNGKPVVELYARGYTAETRLISWSMAKSVTAIALGLLADDGKVLIDSPAPVAAWQGASDPRAKITIRHLLGMVSGLEHQEGTEGGRAIETADTPRMLFTDGSSNSYAYATAKPLLYVPGTVWKYSTASTQILAEIVARQITTSTDPAERRRATAAWFDVRLWKPLGITSAEWDYDPAGLFLGGAMLHMTARDWGRLGQLLLDRGMAPDGKRLLSESWLGVMLNTSLTSNNNHYAGHVWLNTGPAANQQPVLFHPRGGADTYTMAGHLGQYVTIIPSKRAVLVRLGKSTGPERAKMMPALADLIEALVLE
jgi:CubicO group peptidase (beta-lactamase class C family)